MNSKVRDCLVENFEQLILTLSLPDPNDCHVLAAAIVSEANFIVTFNLKDFPDIVLATYEIAAKHPDNFIAELLEVNPTKVMNAVEIARKRFKNPPRKFDEYMEILLRQGLSISVCMLQEFYGN